MKGGWKLMLLVFSVIVLLAVLLSYQLEQVSENDDIPPSVEVQRNPLVAAKRTLTALGWEVLEIDGRPDDFRQAGATTVIWPGPRGSVSRHALDAAEAFVAGGGHLIVEAEEWYDPVLKRFSIDVVQHEDHFDDDELEDFEHDDYDEDDEFYDDESGVDQNSVDKIADVDTSEAGEPGAANRLTKSELPPLEQGEDASDSLGCGCEPQQRWPAGEWLGEPTLTFELPHSGWLTSDEPLLAAVGPTDEPQIVQIRQGEGWVTAFTSEDIFSNDSLGRADHAEALARLVALPGPVGRVLIVRASPGGFGAWLMEHAWRILIFVGLLIVLALWRAIPRFGPISDDPPPIRRRLLDHLLASGRLLWSRGEQKLLARAAAESALARVYAEYPHARWLPEPAFNAFMQRRFEIDSSLLTLLRNPDGVRHTQSLITLTRCAQRIHKSLSVPGSEPVNSSLYDRRENS